MLVPLVAAGLAACPAPPPVHPAASRPRYALTVRIRPGFREVDGTLAVTFTPQRRTDRLVFRLWANAPRLAAAGARLTVGPVLDRGRALRTSSPDATTLVVRPGRALGPEAPITVRTTWRLRLPSGHADRIARWTTGLRLASFFPLLSWDDRRGWVVDPPTTVPAETSTSPTADFDMRVRAPAGVRLVASGEAAGPGRFRARAVRDFALAAGRFRTISTQVAAPRPVRVRVAYQGGVDRHRYLRLAAAALRRLARLYGPYPWRSYTLVVPPDLGVLGIEYPTLVFVGRELPTIVIPHETAHQWFYSLVGNDQARDPWLDEALATWAATRLGARDRRPVPAAARGHVGAPMTYWARRPELYAAGVYREGVRALASLGDPGRVDCGLRIYAARNAYRIASPSHLLDALERVLPGTRRRLAPFGIHG